MRIIHVFVLLLLGVAAWAATPIKGLLERIDKGASRKFIIEQTNAPTDFFELDQKDDKVVVRGNNYVCIATGLNWYLQYYAGIHLSWNSMQAELPEVLPAVKQKERHETTMKYRYNFNYCTFSYTMAFWDWERWEKEIDWMALHGINLPLSIVGADCVWYHVLDKLGYTPKEINEFIAGPGFQAWWLMNNLEGWGGPNPDSWYKKQMALQQRIVKRMREYGIEPVFPGYSGMVPHNAKEKLGLNVSDPGLWCGYHRPAFLQPTDSRFQEIASLYYKEMNKLFGKANYYSMDPFHEGGSVAGVDLDAAGKSIMQAMKKNNPKSVWVAQAWQDNPRPKMIENLKSGDFIVLDLFAESRPQWGNPESTWYRKNGFGQHDWIFCMLLNYGGNVGLHGKMEHIINEYYNAKESRFGKTMKGIGLTMEGSENNPIMFELMTELPWRSQRFDKDQWLKSYTKTRYGKSNSAVEKAWRLLSNSIYNCPPASTQQGTHESVFCARPSEHPYQVSSWSEMNDYYHPNDVIRAASLMVSVAHQFKGNTNFEYDLVDIVRQAIAERGRLIEKVVEAAYASGDKVLYKEASNRFLNLILLQDKLLATRPEFKVGTWINRARDLGNTLEEKALYEWNARVQITTWGNRTAADKGGLRDYAHREWSGLLKDFYYMRWKTWFDYQTKLLNGEKPKAIDFYAIEEAWTKQTNAYSNQPEGDCIQTVKQIFAELF